MDNKNFTIYDITSKISIGENFTPFGKFKCYMDHSVDEFYLEINESTPKSIFTRSTIINLLDIAENQNAKKLLVCLRNSTNDLGKIFFSILIHLNFIIAFL